MRELTENVRVSRKMHETWRSVSWKKSTADYAVLQWEPVNSSHGQLVTL